MPIYEYICPDPTCSHYIHPQEMFFSVNTFPKGVFCTECGEYADLIISRNSFHLKGDGWAKDNYTKKEKE